MSLDLPVTRTLGVFYCRSRRERWIPKRRGSLKGTNISFESGKPTRVWLKTHRVWSLGREKPQHAEALLGRC